MTETASPTDLATLVAAKLCHDFISPAGAVVSGLDLLNDPSAQDMRDDALGLIDQSARKMVALVHFARVAFGAATTSEKFDGRELQTLVAGMTDGGRDRHGRHEGVRRYAGLYPNPGARS